MKNALLMKRATGGHKSVPADWVSATALRPLLQDDPCLVWLKYHGAKHSLTKDSGEYQFLDFIGEIGKRFEAKWLAEVAPDAVFANEHDHDVRNADSVERTLRLMSERHRVIAKAALWWEPCGIYGTADIIVLRSWLLEQFPHLADHVQQEAADHYIVLDAKFQSALDTPRKKKHLRLDAVQVQLYSFILGHLQGVMPTDAFLICRDRPFDPLPIQVGYALGDRLEEDIDDLLKTYKWIIKNGAHITPWGCPLIRPNFSNHDDAPWSQTKKTMLSQRWPHKPLESLPYIGARQAHSLEEMGYKSVEDLLVAPRHEVDADLIRVPRFGRARAAMLSVLLEANRTGCPTSFASDAVPPKCRVEMAVDFEFLSDLHVDPDTDWPDLQGREMVFAVGATYETGKVVRTRTFFAEAETAKAERAMWREFLNFLAKKGIHANHNGTGVTTGGAALYHWSPAEPAQARAAAERLGMPELAYLPWLDLRATWLQAGIALPEQWNYGLKTVSAALGKWSPNHAINYPTELASGMDAQVMAWRAYERADPLDTQKMGLIDQYLKTDCIALWNILDWMRQEKRKLTGTHYTRRVQSGLDLNQQARDVVYR